MGAAQAIAVGGGPNPPRGLVGLLVVDPCSRGRYGLRLSDRTDFLPTGDGTFGVEEFAQTLGHVCVMQWHAADDTIDSRTWLAELQAPHKEIDFPQTGHYYSEGREDFLRQLTAQRAVGPFIRTVTASPPKGAPRDREPHHFGPGGGAADRADSPASGRSGDDPGDGGSEPGAVAASRSPTLWRWPGRCAWSRFSTC